MEIGDAERIYNESYDRFTDYFMNHKSKITALAELEKNREAFQRRINNLNESINKKIRSLDHNLNNFCKRKKSYKVKEKIVEKLRRNFKNRYHLHSPEEMLEEYKIQLKQLYKIEGEQDEIRSSHGINFILWDGEKIKKIECQLNALKSIINNIMDECYSPDLDSYKYLDGFDIGITTSGDYRPHHNTRKHLIKDLKKIINDIKDKPRFFHEDGTIKHTTVAKYAVNQNWFAEKHGHGKRGLHKHIKRIYSDMNCT
ncbi:hypothetical protein NC796_23185 [Aliifodinibius sp. S!AR15-10]|uniref:hypothetical protein n=1 Tax=Aliifodinibius sp. S!AR15-10 TaxID=2950437 RepID=UPI0028585212|nr:hypothetical protein [Aliifodinibius sp. S!AR15-10]MDR8394077.1 hypothetical protein [Aliifodinibius sp. S!AR15-10]